jgi:diguanylate cyclase (GGDEF)-like protein/PAS domain S-box-containing protein
MLPAKLRILMIDDDEDDWFITSELADEMPSLKADLSWARSSVEALTILERVQFDILLVDYLLDGMTGVELLKKLKKTKDVPIVLLTGQGSAELEHQAIQHGAADYLIKGQFNAEQFQRCLIYSIDRHKANQYLYLFKRALDTSYNGVVIADANAKDMPIVYVNKSFERITGYMAADVLGKNCRFLQGHSSDEKTRDVIRNALQTKTECHLVIQNFKKDGSMFWNNLCLSPVPDDSGFVNYFIGIQNDITEQKRYEAELEFNASHDLLTGLPNRSMLQDRLLQSCESTRSQHRNVAVMFIDLDGFKLVNDSLGHSTGDKLLIEVARRIDNQIRTGDTLARLGGDEFVAVLSNFVNEEDVVVVAERILKEITKNFIINGHEIHLTASIGISLSDGSLRDPVQLIQQADLAMHQAKALGHNNYQWFSNKLDMAVGEQLNMRNRIQKAIIKKDFKLFYQPQIDAHSGKVIALEALLRWPQVGGDNAISPAEFIPIAEKSGQIVPLSAWVFEEACLYNQHLQANGIAELVIAVNVSSTHFQRPDFVPTIELVLEVSGMQAQYLELEITESVLFDNSDLAIHKLQQLKSLGVRISIDDFGTGFSSLNYLKTLPIDKIKIDRTFIKEIISDHRDAAITKSIITMAHLLGLRVIAEGVETEAQVGFLSKTLCDEYQGFYFAKPMPPERLETFLKVFSQTPKTQEKIKQQTILLLDDEQNILHALVRLLRKDGYNILCANSGEQAFELLAMNNIQVILSDQRMPNISGTEVLKVVKELYPNTIRLVLSGFTDLKSVTEAINSGAIYKFITKPWNDVELRNEIRQAFVQFDRNMYGKEEVI